MAFKIGFNADTTGNTEFETAEAGNSAGRTPKLSLVQVYFPERNMTLTYYNDSFGSCFA